VRPVAAKADRVQVVGVIDLLCDTPAAGSALKGELEIITAERTGDPGGAHWSSPLGLLLAFDHPAARCCAAWGSSGYSVSSCSWSTALFRSAAAAATAGQTDRCQLLRRTRLPDCRRAPNNEAALHDLLAFIQHQYQVSIGANPARCAHGAQMQGAEGG
jgi:hypothetical protein